MFEIMWNNIVERDRPQMTIWSMHITCRTIKARDTHSEYVILIAVSRQLLLHERSSLLRYTYTILPVLFHSLSVCYGVAQ